MTGACLLASCDRVYCYVKARSNPTSLSDFGYVLQLISLTAFATLYSNASSVAHVMRTGHLSGMTAGFQRLSMRSAPRAQIFLRTPETGWRAPGQWHDVAKGPTHRPIFFQKFSSHYTCALQRRKKATRSDPCRHLKRASKRKVSLVFAPKSSPASPRQVRESSHSLRS